MGSMVSLEGRHVGRHHLCQQLNANPVFENVPRGCRSKRRSMDKEIIEVAEPVNHFSKGQCSRRKRTREASDSSDSEITIPRLRVRGQLRRPVDSFDSTTKYRKLDSKTFEGYLENIWHGFSEEKTKSFTYLDSLWFFLYMQSSSKDKVLQWVKGKNIFSKKYVMVPIVIWSHWSLLILCNFGESEQSQTRTRCMLLLDSLQTMNPRRLEPGIRKFILDVHNVEEMAGGGLLVDKIPLLTPQVPQQRDGEECGFYVLQYISLFVENASDNFSISNGYPYFMKEDWFTLEGLDNFCKRLELNSASRNSSVLSE